MNIERIGKRKLTITLSSSIGSADMQRLIDYAKYLEFTAKGKAKQKNVDALADEVNATWWSRNKKRLLQ